MENPSSRWVHMKPPTRESVAFFLLSYQDGLVEFVKNDRGEVRLYRTREAAEKAATDLAVHKPGIVGMAQDGFERFQREQPHAFED